LCSPFLGLGRADARRTEAALEAAAQPNPPVNAPRRAPGPIVVEIPTAVYQASHRGWRFIEVFGGTMSLVQLRPKCGSILAYGGYIVMTT
jgi:hypothetical protein